METRAGQPPRVLEHSPLSGMPSPPRRRGLPFPTPTLRAVPTPSPRPPSHRGHGQARSCPESATGSRIQQPRRPWSRRARNESAAPEVRRGPDTCHASRAQRRGLDWLSGPRPEIGRASRPAPSTAGPRDATTPDPARRSGPRGPQRPKDADGHLHLTSSLPEPRGCPRLLPPVHPAPRCSGDGGGHGSTVTCRRTKRPWAPPSGEPAPPREAQPCALPSLLSSSSWLQVPPPHASPKSRLVGAAIALRTFPYAP